MANEHFIISTRSRRGQALFNYLIELSQGEKYITYAGEILPKIDTGLVELTKEEIRLIKKTNRIETGLTR